MTHKFDRRQALAALGTVTLGSVLAACGGDGDTTTGTQVTTTDGATATVTPRTTTSGATADRFDAAASCAITPELTEGPYYFDVDAIRSDIREDRDGTLLRLAVRVRDAESCEPLRNAVVDVWHCDAGGSYSGFESASMGGGPTDEETYLRGAQVTNADGVVEFKTIYPGAYPGRTVHVHAKVHLDRRTVLTTQFFFDEAVTERVYAKSPYADDPARQSNVTDGIFDDRLILTLSEEDDGLLGLINLDVQRA